MQALLRLLGPLVTRILFGAAESKGGQAAAALWKSRARALRNPAGKAAMNRWGQPAQAQQAQQQSALAGIMQTILQTLHLRQANVGQKQATTSPAGSGKNAPAVNGRAVFGVLRTVTQLVVPGLAGLLGKIAPLRNLATAVGASFSPPGSAASAGGGLSPKQLISMMGSTPAQIKAAQQAAGAGRAAGGGAALAGMGAVGAVTKVLVGFVAVAAVLTVVQRVLKSFGEHVVEGNRYLTQFNGKIGAAYARLDRQQITLGLRQGRATENSTSGAADALHDLNESMQPLAETFGTLGNALGTGALKIATLLAHAGDIATTVLGIKAIAALIEGNTRTRFSGATPDIDHFRRVASGEYGRGPAPRAPLAPLP